MTFSARTFWKPWASEHPDRELDGGAVSRGIRRAGAPRGR